MIFPNDDFLEKMSNHDFESLKNALFGNREQIEKEKVEIRARKSIEKRAQKTLNQRWKKENAARI